MHTTPDRGPDELFLPDDVMLLAKIVGGSHKHHPYGMRVMYMSAAIPKGRGEPVAVVRGADGAVLHPPRRSASTPYTPLPEDWGQEAIAMLDVSHVMDWLNGSQVEIGPTIARGVSEDVGRFVCRIHETHRYVTSLDADDGCGWRNLISMCTHHVVPFEWSWFEGSPIDPRAIESALWSGGSGLTG